MVSISLLAAPSTKDSADLTEILRGRHMLRQPGGPRLVGVAAKAHRTQDVARRLRRRSPPISSAEVQAVFSRYRLGQKGGRSRS